MSTTSSPLPPTLVSHLSSSLAALAPPRPLTIQLFQTAPRRTNSLFAHSTHHPKHTTIQDLLLLLYVHPKSEELPSHGNIPTKISAEITDLQPAGETDATTMTAVTPTTDSAPLLLTALEVQLFTSPTSSTTTLYISKADTSGYALPSTLPSRPYTKTLLSAFLTFYLDPQTRPTVNIDIHLFARSQNQYLFPDSGDLLPNGRVRKKILTGGKLCKWWKGVFEEAVETSQKGRDAHSMKVEPQEGSSAEASDARKIAMSFMIPGLSEAEANQALGVSSLNTSTSSNRPEWKYSLVDLPTALHPTTSSLHPAPPKTSLADLIPTFEDDPRTRFLDELATPPTPSFPTYSKPRPTPTAASNPSALTLKDIQAQQSQQSLQASNEARQVATRLLSEHSQAEFYELLGCRQECMLGSTVGFFCVSDFQQEQELTEERPKKQPSTEGEEQAAGDTPVPSTNGNTIDIVNEPTQTHPPTASTRVPSHLPKALYTRLYSTLLNQAFATDLLVQLGSKVVWDTCRTLLSEDQLTEARIEAVEPSPEGERKRKIEGGESGEAGEKKAEVVVVNSLQVRKKKKKVLE